MSNFINDAKKRDQEDIENQFEDEILRDIDDDNNNLIKENNYDEEEEEEEERK